MIPKRYLAATMAWTLAIAGAIGMSSIAQAANPVAWTFSAFTDGSDDSWTSPTSIDTGFDQYSVDYEITVIDIQTNKGLFVLADLIFFGLDPNSLLGSEVVGELPQTLYTGAVDFSGTGADVILGINGTGQGYASLANVVLGTVNLPLLGDTEIQSLAIGGTINAIGSNIPEPASLLLIGSVAMPLMMRRRRHVSAA